jgi:fibronectin type 3 domain-containing protein
VSSLAPKRVRRCNRRGGGWNRRQPFGLLFFLTFLVAAPTQSGCTGSTSPIPHRVTLVWIASSTSAVVGYNVYRGTASGGPYTLLNSSLVTTTQYHDSSVQSGKTYYYVVTAVDSSYVESAFSGEASATVPTP